MDEPVRYFTVEGAGTTVVHPLGAAMLLLCGVLFVLLPRKHAVWPLAVLTCFVSSRQCIAVLGINLYFSRLMVMVFGLARLLLKGEHRTFRPNTLDALVLAYGITYLVAGAINWDFSLVEIKTRAGYITDVLGMYLLMRLILHTVEDFHIAVICLATISLPLFGFFALEHSTGRNLFSVFGGVPEITAVREGRLRCQGAFGHAIMAGTIWASFLPLFIYGALALPRRRALMVTAISASVGIVVLCASSTPVLGVACTAAGMLLYPFRAHIRSICAFVVATLVCLHMVMQAPVWALIARINLTAGNSGYHRYILIDGFINHWEEWWLLGSRVGTAHWGHYTFDTANQFVVVGVGGGLMMLLAFFGVIVLAFRAAGKLQASSPLLGWLLGTSVAVHCVCFLGIGIWGQLHFAWSLPLAAIGSLAFPVGPRRLQGEHRLTLALQRPNGQRPAPVVPAATVEATR